MESQTIRRYQSWRVYLKPDTAGIRILTLDGGGIRGIVELEILRLIERAMNGKLPIQCFFDLIVGTSTGGLIALGLASRNWSVDECINHFEQLCDKAFTRRSGGNIPLIGWLVDNYNHSKFETAPLQEALISAFSDDQYLFGGRRPDQSSGCSPVKVAVTATSASGSAVVLANYNRHCSEKLPYQFQRPEKVSAELKIWETARATSAAPRIFRSFHHEPSKQVYMDGALYHNNPIQIAERERKLIWDKEVNEYPDLIVSIGTSFNPHARRVPVKKSSAARLGVFAHGKILAKIAKDHIAASLDCERTWSEFMSTLPDSARNSRFVRLNPELQEDPPELDDVSRMKSLQDTVRAQMSENPRINKLAMQLAMTSFYFETTRPLQEYEKGIFVAQGYIFCRIPSDTREISVLGKLIRDRGFQRRNPFFLIQEEGSTPGTLQQIELTPDIISAMIQEQKFHMRKINVRLHNKLAATEIFLYLNDGENYPISGFPRSLLQDCRSQADRRHPLAVSSNRWASRSLSQQMRRGKWTPPNSARLQRNSTISEYANEKQHVIGFASADELQRSAELLTNGPGPKQETEQESHANAAELDSVEISRQILELPTSANSWPESPQYDMF